jgi:hypothetical protein
MRTARKEAEQKQHKEGQHLATLTSSPILPVGKQYSDLEKKHKHKTIQNRAHQTHASK